MAYEYAIILTGGIATGKSTVSSLLRVHGFDIIDADLIAKEIMPLHVEDIRTLFGNDVINDGNVDRKALGALIFANKAAREKLNTLMLPLIRKEIYKRSNVLETKKKPYIIDMPLYFESDGYECKFAAVVYAPEWVQKERLMKREYYTHEEAQMRIDAQICIEEKKKKADYVIDNSLDLKSLEEEVKKFINFIRGKYAVNQI